MSEANPIDADLGQRIEGLTQAWRVFEESSRGFADAAKLAYWISAVAVRAKQLWEQPGMVDLFYDQAEIAIDAWQALIDRITTITAKDLSDAIIRTVIVEKTRLAIDHDWDEYWRKFFWINLQRARPEVLLFALATGELTPEDLVEDVERTIKTTERLADKVKSKIKDALWGSVAPIVGILALAFLARGSK